MGYLDQLNYLINFLAPALAVGATLALLGPLFGGKPYAVRTLLAQISWNSLAGALALGLGLWFFGRDAKMASYAAMLVCCALSQGLMLRR